jgi:hypothetical protein
LSIDLPTADEPAANLDIEEAGLWLRFFVARPRAQENLRAQEKTRRQEPAG